MKCPVMPGEYPFHFPHGIGDIGLYCLHCHTGLCRYYYQYNDYCCPDYYHYYRGYGYSNYDGHYCSNYHGYGYSDYNRHYCSNYHGYYSSNDNYGNPAGCLIHCISHFGYCATHRAV